MEALLHFKMMLKTEAGYFENGPAESTKLRGVQYHPQRALLYKPTTTFVRNVSYAFCLFIINSSLCLAFHVWYILKCPKWTFVPLLTSTIADTKKAQSTEYFLPFINRRWKLLLFNLHVLSTDQNCHTMSNIGPYATPMVRTNWM